MHFFVYYFKIIFLEFINEFVQLRKLQHPNILQFDGIFKIKDSNQCAIITEYAEGGNLHSLLMNKDHEISLSRATDYAFQVAEGMKYLHEQVFHFKYNYFFRILFIEI